jgi:hypothetical protein
MFFIFRFDLGDVINTTILKGLYLILLSLYFSNKIKIKCGHLKKLQHNCCNGFTALNPNPLFFLFEKKCYDVHKNKRNFEYFMF